MSTNYNLVTKNRFAGLATDDESDAVSKEGAQTKKAQVAGKAPKTESSVKRTDTASNKPAAKSYPKKTSKETFNVAPRNSTARSTTRATSEPEKLTPKDTADGDLQVDQQKPVHARRGNKQRFTREKAMNGTLRPNKRVYDRHSAMPRSKDLKKQTAGNYTLDAEAEEADKEEAKEEDSTIDNGGKESAEKPVKMEKAPSSANYSEYQRKIQAMRETLMYHEMGEVQDMAGMPQHQNADYEDLVKAGYEKYEKQYEDEETQKAKGRKQKHFYDNMHNTGVEDDSTHRQKTYGISEFAGRLSMRPRGRGRARRTEDSRRADKAAEAQHTYIDHPVALDLADTAAFPTLKG